jgi:hypothetical protein
MDLIGEGITTNKVEDNSLLKVDDVLPKMMIFEIRNQIGTTY